MYNDEFEYTPMQKFVIGFMKKRKEQKEFFVLKKMLAVYVQVGRFNHLRNYISNKFTGSGILKKSGMFDFMMFLLEGFIKREYGDYETFDEYYERVTNENLKDSKHATLSDYE